MTSIFFTIAAAMLLISILTAKSAFDTKKEAEEDWNLAKVLLSVSRINIEKTKRMLNNCSLGTLPSAEETKRLIELAKAKPNQRTHILLVLKEVLEENNVTD